MLDSFLRHVTKDSYGPIPFTEKTPVPAVVHKFNDSFSVMGWGKMPDLIEGRGRLLAAVFAKLNQNYQSAESWKNFLRSPDALSFRKAGASLTQSGNVSAMLNEISGRLPVRSNFLGILGEKTFREMDAKTVLNSSLLLSAGEGAGGRVEMVYPVCEYFPEEKVPVSTVMGRAVWDHSIWRNQGSPKLLPF